MELVGNPPHTAIHQHGVRQVSEENRSNCYPASVSDELRDECSELGSLPRLLRLMNKALVVQPRDAPRNLIKIV